MKVIIASIFEPFSIIRSRQKQCLTKKNFFIFLPSLICRSRKKDTVKHSFAHKIINLMFLHFSNLHRKKINKGYPQKNPLLILFVHILQRIPIALHRIPKLGGGAKGTIRILEKGLFIFFWKTPYIRLSKHLQISFLF